MTDVDSIDEIVAQSNSARELFFREVLPRFRAQLKAVGYEAQNFGYGPGTTDKTFVPKLGTLAAVQAAFEGPTLAERLPSLPVETLLDQATKLIDRIAVDDASRRAMAIDSFNLGLDVDEYLALDQINDKEIEAGLYKLPWYDAAASYDGEMQAKIWQDNFVTSLDKTRDRQQKRSGWATEVAQRDIHGDPRATNLWGGYSSSLDVTRNENKDSGLYAFDGWLGGVISYEITYNQINMQLIQYNGEASVSNARIPHFKSKVDYYTQDVKFRAQRRAVAQLKLHRRIAEMTRPDGALNYPPRIEACIRRMKADLSAAYVRLTAAKDGLALVYGIEMGDVLPPIPGVNENPLEDMISWIRTANDALQRTTLSDNSSIIRVSLRQHIGADFLKQLSDGAKFTLSWDLLPNSKLVRLRGASASFVPVEGPQTFSVALTVRPPRESAIFRYTGAVRPIRESDIFVRYTNAASTTSETKPQSVSECIFGRVQAITSPQAMDVLGGQGWFNASPFGEWFVRLAPMDPPPKISDIYLDLFLVSQPIV